VRALLSFWAANRNCRPLPPLPPSWRLNVRRARNRWWAMAGPSGAGPAGRSSCSSKWRRRHPTCPPRRNVRRKDARMPPAESPGMMAGAITVDAPAIACRRFVASATPIPCYG